MRAWFLLMAFLLSQCVAIPRQTAQDWWKRAVSVSSLRQTFYAPGCDQTCWLGIEPELTDRATVLNILQSNGVAYAEAGVIHILSVPEGSFLARMVTGIPSVEGHIIYGDINVGRGISDVVHSLDFYVDLCVSTVVAVYGPPKVWFVREGVPTTIAYPDEHLFFAINPTTLRIEQIVLQSAGAMPPETELKDWEAYATLFSAPCVDALTDSE